MMKSDDLNVDGRNANEMKEPLFVVTPYLKGLHIQGCFPVCKRIT